jgi:hypothetical protein
MIGSRDGGWWALDLGLVSGEDGSVAIFSRVDTPFLPESVEDDPRCMRIPGPRAGLVLVSCMALRAHVDGLKCVDNHMRFSLVVLICKTNH